jgi:hypothetical protein
VLFFLCMRSKQHQWDDFQKEKVLVLYRRIYNLFIKKCLLGFTISLLCICIVQHCTKLVYSLYKGDSRPHTQILYKENRKMLFRAQINKEKKNKDGEVLFIGRPELNG